MNAAKNVRIVSQIIRRQLSKSAAVKTAEPARVQKLKALQKHFQIDDGTPVYIKGGVGDKILYGFTCALIAVGLGMSGEVLYNLAVK